jgi:carbonic anhydrase/acetyltransferase-like protein (isoleucine patch superfamily)
MKRQNLEESKVALYALGELVPLIDHSAFVHPDATVIGAVTIGPGSSVWPAAVLRGDSGVIRIGAQTSIQDGSVLHATEHHDTVVGDRCVVGHLAHLEGCWIDDDALIGSGAIVLHRARVRSWALVGAGALVPNDFEVPTRAMALGVPARLRPDSVDPELIRSASAIYVANALRYRVELRRLD